MYGYVVVNKPELKIKEYDMYRSYYCGLCEELLSDYGINGQISISYDMTFLLVLLTGLYEPDTTYKEARCIAHPVHKHPVRRNKISAYSQKARIIKAALDRMSELENNNESNIDLLAEQFGIIMAQILCMKNDEWYDTLKVMGNSLGRFIYILDAYDDLLEDKKKGRYNALRTYENNKDFDIFIENVLKSHMAQFAAGFESLPIIENVDLLRNVIYSGVFTRFGIAKNKREQVEEV